MASNSEVQEYLREQIEELAATLSVNHFDNKINWAQANFDYGRTACILAETEHGTKSYELYAKAIDAFNKALKVYKGKAYIKLRCSATLALAKTLRLYSLQKGGLFGQVFLLQALALLQKLEKLLTNVVLYREFVNLRCEEAYLYRSLAYLVPHNGRLGYLKQASAAFTEAAKILQQKEDFTDWGYILLVQAHLCIEISKLENPEESYKSLKAAAGLLGAVIESSKHPSYSSAPVIQDSEYISAAIELGRTYGRLANPAHINSYLPYLVNALSAFSLVSKTMAQQLETVARLKFYQNKAAILSLLAKEQKHNKPALALYSKAINLYEDCLVILSRETSAAYTIDILFNLAKVFVACALRSSLDFRKQHIINSIDNLRKAIALSCVQDEKHEYITLSLALAASLHQLAVLETKIDLALLALIETRKIYETVLKLNPRVNEANLNRLALYNKLASIYVDISAREPTSELARKQLYKSLVYRYRAAKLYPQRQILKLKLNQRLVEIACLNPSPAQHMPAIEKNIAKLINSASNNSFWAVKAKHLQIHFYYRCAIDAKLLQKIAYLTRCYRLYAEIDNNSIQHQNIATELRALYKRYWLRLLLVKKLKITTIS